ncbi:MAG: hypothetical protein GY934_16465 [Gammaproteobacteria bacterium]|nr:hypothetical protein [Gammaproteobacteria bacterium]
MPKISIAGYRSSVIFHAGPLPSPYPVHPPAGGYEPVPEQPYATIANQTVKKELSVFASMAHYRINLAGL